MRRQGANSTKSMNLEIQMTENRFLLHLVALRIFTMYLKFHRLVMNSKVAKKAERRKYNKILLERQKRIRKLNMVLEKTFQSDTENDETECIKTMLLSTDKENIFSESSNRTTSVELNTANEEIVSKPRDSTILELSTDKEKRLSKPGDRTNFSPTNSVSKCEADIQQLRQRIMQREGEQTMTRNEISEEHRIELHMLKELQEQLNSIRSEMRIWKSKKSSRADDWRLATLQEAMLHFWL